MKPFPKENPPRSSSAPASLFLILYPLMPLSPQQAVERRETIMSHAWMVRTFVKHSSEVQTFPS